MTATLAFDPVAPEYSFFNFCNAEVLENGNLEYGLCATTACPRIMELSFEITQTTPSADCMGDAGYWGNSCTVACVYPVSTLASSGRPRY